MMSRGILQPTKCDANIIFYSLNNIHKSNLGLIDERLKNDFPLYQQPVFHRIKNSNTRKSTKSTKSTKSINSKTNKSNYNLKLLSASTNTKKNKNKYITPLPKNMTINLSQSSDINV